MPTSQESPHVTAPWDEETVAALNAYQQHPHYHPYTCGMAECGGKLTATTSGWQCNHCCGWLLAPRQSWAHEVNVALGRESLRDERRKALGMEP
jgi:hypothetical protein